jgi:hypothetical protein
MLRSPAGVLHGEPRTLGVVVGAVVALAAEQRDPDEIARLSRVRVVGASSPSDGATSVRFRALLPATQRARRKAFSIFLSADR